MITIFTSIRIAIVFIVCHALSAWAQSPADRMQQAAAKGDADSAFAALAASYAGTPVAERTLFTVDVGGKRRQGSATLRAFPAVSSAQASPAPLGVLGIELGPLRVSFDRTEFTVISQDDDRAVVRRKTGGGLLRSELAQIVPPVPLLQLDLIAGPDHAMTSLRSWLPGTGWSEIAERRGAWQLTGRVQTNAAGPEDDDAADQDRSIIVIIEKSSLRIRSFELPLAGGRLRANVAPVDQGEPAAAMVPAAGRVEVAHIGKLQGGGRPRALVGRRLPDLAPFAPHREPGTPPFLPQDTPAILILFRAKGDGAGAGDSAESDVRAAIRECARMIHERPDAGRVAIRLVGAIPLGGIDPDSLATSAAGWEAIIAAAGLDADAFAWSPSAAAAIFDQVERVYDAMIIASSPARSVESIIGVDGGAADADRLRVELAAAFRKLDRK